MLVPRSGTPIQFQPQPPEGSFLNSSELLWMAMPIWRRLLAQLMRSICSRTFCTAGTKRAINTAIIAMTTKSSIRVNPDRRDVLRSMAGLLKKEIRSLIQINFHDASAHDSLTQFPTQVRVGVEVRRQ